MTAPGNKWDQVVADIFAAIGVTVGPKQIADPSEAHTFEVNAAGSWLEPVRGGTLTVTAVDREAKPVTCPGCAAYGRQWCPVHTPSTYAPAPAKPTDYIIRGGPIETDASALDVESVDCTEAELARALWHADPEVRSLLLDRGEVPATDCRLPGCEVPACARYRRVAEIAWERREPPGSREKAEKLAQAAFEWMTTGDVET